MKLSLIINADTRPQNDEIGGMFNGTTSADYLVHGVWNKLKFFSGFKIECILYIDEHIKLSKEDIDIIKPLCSTLVIRQHTDENNFNEWNYYRAFSMASGDIVCHCDQDTSLFTSGKEYVDELISHLDNYKFVSYPSHWSPNPVHDESFGGVWWASTRFFMCEIESLKLDELAMCINEPNWMYKKYGDSPRRCNWTEHFLNKINGNSCLYPPVELHKGAIFSWSHYKSGTLPMLNELDYESVKQWILHRGGVNYPVDVKCE